MGLFISSIPSSLMQESGVLQNSMERGLYVYSHSVVSDKSVELFDFDVHFN